ncbi:MAG: MFS transporter [Rhodospirillaceae bacterium]|nr:MFS transporter [Rhodospirillaceae bacterium]
MSLRDPSVRNVALLAACQALAMTGMTITATVTALVGDMLSNHGPWSTLPLAMQFTATMATTMPASLFMRRFGRKAGFALGVVIGVAGSGMAIYAITNGSFLLFVVASIMIGTFMGFSVFYRYAAADTASEAFRPKAISLVMAGGVVAAVFGPELSKWSFELLAPATFAGSYVAIAVVHGSILAVLFFVDIPREKVSETGDTGRPLSEIVRQPKFLIAAVGGMIGYGVMSFIMTATPLAMIGCGLEFRDTAFVIQWHALGMFAPSFFTGSLINRFGVLRVMFVGALLLAASVAVNLSGLELMRFFSGLVLLGLGWNFLFIGGTTLLTETYEPAEKAKVQGLNDLLVFTTVSASSFASGALLHLFGWQAVNLGVIPLILIVVLLIGWQRFQTARATA